MASATLHSCEVGTYLPARCYVAEITETRIISEWSLTCLIFDCFLSSEDISHSHEENTESTCWRSEQSKGVLGEFFDRIKALKSKRQLLKMNSKTHTSFEAADWAKKNNSARDRGAAVAVKAQAICSMQSVSHKDVDWGKENSAVLDMPS